MMGHVDDWSFWSNSTTGSDKRADTNKQKSPIHIGKIGNKLSKVNFSHSYISFSRLVNAHVHLVIVSSPFPCKYGHKLSPD